VRRSVGVMGTPSGKDFDGITRVRPEELAGSLQGPERPILVDVRRPSERRWGWIPGDVSIPLEELPVRLAEIPRSRPVVLYSRDTAESEQAARLLGSAGLTSVRLLEGGLDAYARTVDPTVGRYGSTPGGEGWVLWQIPRVASGCLSYLLCDIASSEAVLVDPGVETDPYLARLKEHGLRLKAIVETHTHADHLSGHAELHARTGAPIWLSRRSPAQYPHERLADGDTLALGERALSVLETPGHTSDHLTLRFEGLAFTGDTLLVGGCGRTDLGDGSPELLWESFQTKLLKLPDSTEVLPAHYGPRHGLPGRFSTFLGIERATNEALAQPDWSSFKRYMEEGWPPKPADFDRIVATNLSR
jgi:glyoxylase-like metal-dependent hydrolase (beta-lactamase superfamily II)